MGVKRVTIRLRPDIISGKDFRKSLSGLINFLNDKSPCYFAYCFEQNEEIEKFDERSEVHFHACFLSWNNAGNSDYERIIKKHLPWMEWLECGAILDKTGKGSAVMVNSKPKGTEEQFVGYLFKDDEHHSVGWDIDHCRSEYQKGLETAKISWFTVYKYIEEQYKEYQNNFKSRLSTSTSTAKMDFDLFKEKEALGWAVENAIEKYKDSISIGMLINISKLKLIVEGK